MEKLYRKIARREELAKNSIHLVHYVLGSMRESYAPPPKLASTQGSAYSAKDVCAAILAYLRAHHPEAPIGTGRSPLVPSYW